VVRRAIANRADGWRPNRCDDLSGLRVPWRGRRCVHREQPVRRWGLFAVALAVALAGCGGSGLNSNSRSKAVAASEGAHSRGISAGAYYTCALLQGGAVKCWGDNTRGQLGTGDTVSREAPPATSVHLGGSATQITAGGFHTCALLGGGSVKCWGDNSDGQLGTGDHRSLDAPPSSPIKLGGVATQIAAGDYTTCAVLRGGSVKCWGDNSDGQLGTGDSKSLDAPPSSPINLGGVATQITPTYRHTCALLRGGTVKCWGNNLTGQLGTGNSASVKAPPASPIGLGSSATQITAAGQYTCALLQGGAVKCWGYNGNGQLGTGDNASRNAPPARPVRLSGSATQIIAGGFHTCVLLRAGRVKCWGSNSQGELGAGDNTSRNAPPTSPIRLGAVAVQITAVDQTCALLRGGSIKCWGYNGSGELGTGDRKSLNAPPAGPINVNGTAG
jgi:alpha-tubulin suppressor-like RCC1 family protein